MRFEEHYLDHILSHLERRDPDDSLLVTLMNSWFAHYAGPPFLDQEGRPRWLSKKRTKELVLEDLHARSKASVQLHAARRFGEIVIDHAIPSKVLVGWLKDRPFSDRAVLREFLVGRYTLSLLTKPEHNETLRPFKSKMPDDWSEQSLAVDPSARFGRYTHPLTQIEFEIVRPH